MSNPLAIGQYNALEMVKVLDFGSYFASDQGEILMPTKWVPQDAQIGDILDVFVFKDSEDRLIATTLHPYAVVGEFAYLEVKQVNDFGAFLDWGMDKDVLVPFREQSHPMKEGYSYIVRLELDPKTDRIIGSAKIRKYLSKDIPTYEVNQAIDGLIFHNSELGFQVIVDQTYIGMLYHNQVFEPLRIGQRLTAYVQHIREDGKIDLSLQKKGYEQIKDAESFLLEALEKQNGFLPYGDHSSPEDIKMALFMSKKAFKKAVGALYKQKLVRMESDGIYLVGK